MLYGIHLSSAGAAVEQVRQDVIANNLANVNTTGFKRDTAVFRERLNAALEDSTSGKVSGDPIFDRIGGGALLDEVSFSDADGTHGDSANPFDMALQGEGFFAVTDGTQRYYTRDGRFHVDPESGELSTIDNHFRVLDASGRPIDVPSGDFRVDTTGTISVDGATVARLGVTNNMDVSQFEKIGAGIYRSRGGDPALSGEEGPLVRQFFLESSDVQSVNEMVDLINSHRAYETNMQMIRIQDGTLARAVSEISRSV